MGKTIVVDDYVHKQITDYQEELKYIQDFVPQIKEIVAIAVKQYIKKARIENSKKPEVILEFPKKEK
jgi:pyruvate-formate lyase-activating enzyme